MYETSTKLQILHHTLVRSNECRTEAQWISFQIENAGLKLEENVGISKIMKLSIVNWAIIMCIFIFAHTFGYATQTRRNLLRIFLFFQALFPMYVGKTIFNFICLIKEILLKTVVY